MLFYEKTVRRPLTVNLCPTLTGLQQLWCCCTVTTYAIIFLICVFLQCYCSLYILCFDFEETVTPAAFYSCPCIGAEELDCGPCSCYCHHNHLYCPPLHLHLIFASCTCFQVGSVTVVFLRLPAPAKWCLLHCSPLWKYTDLFFPSCSCGLAL